MERFNTVQAAFIVAWVFIRTAFYSVDQTEAVAEARTLAEELRAESIKLEQNTNKNN